MKKIYLFSALVAGMAMLSSCGSDDSLATTGSDDANEVKQQIVLQVSNSGDGLLTRAGRELNSSEAKQSIENVKVIICDNSNNIKYVKTIENWNTNEVSTVYSTGGHGREKTLEIPAASKLGAGTYVVYAFGYSSESDYDLSAITGVVDGTATGTFNANTVLSFKNEATNKIGEEIFAGSVDLTVESGKGFSKSVVLNRQVAGAFGYLTDIPYIANATKLQLVASTRNTQLVLGNFLNEDLSTNGSNTSKNVVNGTAAADDKVIYTITLSDWFNSITDSDNDGIIDGNSNWKGDATKYAKGSVFAGNFLIPFQKVDNNSTFTLQLIDNNSTVLRSWIVKLPSSEIATSLTAWSESAFSAVSDYKEDVKVYSVMRNHLYAIGQRPKDEPTTPGGGTDPDIDEPESLNNKQELTLRVCDNWEVIHKMELE